VDEKVKNGIDDTRDRLGRLNVVILIAFALVAAALVFWVVARGPSILDRSDNPRLVEAELRIQRGAILDADSRPLAITSGEDASLVRHYPLLAAAPVVGYYSLRHGTSGIEETFDALLRGETDDFWANFWRVEALGEPQIGRDVRLTLDSRWQSEAEALLGDQTGAVLLFSIPDVAVRAMVSTPGYDPNQLDDDFEQLLVDEQAPLLNRVSQGQYQPGLLLQPFLLAAAIRDGIIDLGDLVEGANRTLTVDGIAFECQASPSERTTWGDVLRSRCPAPMAKVATQMGREGLLQAFSDFGLLNQPELEIPTEGNEAPRIGHTVRAAIGQDEISVSPLQIGLALSALANDGQLMPAQVVLATQDADGQWQNAPAIDGGEQVVPAGVANSVLNAFSQHEGILEHGVVVLSGPDGGSNSWYLGLAPAASPRYGVVIVVENDDQVASSQTVGRTLLKQVLNPDQQRSGQK
jgi:peptidoglycan glycosyltransferase